MHSSARLTAFGRGSVPAAGVPQPLLSCLRPAEAQPSDASGPSCRWALRLQQQRDQDGSDGPFEQQGLEKEQRAAAGLRAQHQAATIAARSMARRILLDSCEPARQSWTATKGTQLQQALHLTHCPQEVHLLLQLPAQLLCDAAHCAANGCRVSTNISYRTAYTKGTASPVLSKFEAASLLALFSPASVLSICMDRDMHLVILDGRAT